jgi:hypothetical protein
LFVGDVLNVENLKPEARGKSGDVAVLRIVYGSTGIPVYYVKVGDVLDVGVGMNAVEMIVVAALRIVYGSTGIPVYYVKVNHGDVLDAGVGKNVVEMIVECIM